MAGGRQVRLYQVATVHDGIAERTQIAMLDGRPVVGFQVYRAKGFDETRIAAQVQETLDALAATHPSLSFDLVTDNVEYTREQYNGSMDMLYEGALLAVLLVWFRSEEHTSELQSLMRISYAVFCLKTKQHEYVSA